jgi:hypothetical protein
VVCSAGGSLSEWLVTFGVQDPEDWKGRVGVDGAGFLDHDNLKPLARLVQKYDVTNEFLNNTPMLCSKHSPCNTLILNLQLLVQLPQIILPLSSHWSVW